MRKEDWRPKGKGREKEREKRREERERERERDAHHINIFGSIQTTT